MPDAETIAQQQELLHIQRQTLATYLQQHAAMGSAHAPPVVSHGIRESRAAIQRIKATLLGWGIAVDDHPGDRDLASSAGEPSVSAGTPSAASTFNFYGSVNSGAASFGGAQMAPEGTTTMGDTINISNVSGSNINVKSTLEHVTQTISALPGDPAAKDELQQLIVQLHAELQWAPTDKQADAEAVAETAKDLVDKAAKEKPNRTLVQISAEGLKQAAANIAAVLPTVLPIATKIATTILSLVP